MLLGAESKLSGSAGSFGGSVRNLKGSPPKSLESAGNLGRFGGKAFGFDVEPF